ncbi:MAG: hypothetical protein MJZ21_05455 [archaeon]|nr:hypothetical protein [archaeon]
MDIISLDFVSVAILIFAVFMVLLGLFAAYFGKGKNRIYGLTILVVGLIVGIVYGYLVYDGPIEAIKNVAAWDLIYQAIVNLLAVGIGAIVAVAIFLVAVLKS